MTVGVRAGAAVYRHEQSGGFAAGAVGSRSFNL
jgi:hypothetical protein